MPAAVLEGGVAAAGGRENSEAGLYLWTTFGESAGFGGRLAELGIVLVPACSTARTAKAPCASL